MTAGLLGRTLGHSLSPQIHRFFGDYEYRLFEREPEDVERFLREGFANGDFDFLNVTIPYKQTVFDLCDELTPIAQKLGNVNFVRRSDDGRLIGDNTDAFGVERLLDSVGADVSGLNCAILGSGGAAHTAMAVLKERGAAKVTFVRRGEVPSVDDDMIVNATPVGMFPNCDDVRIDISSYPRCRYVLDLVYNPSPTRLVREALSCGKKAADGMVMLIAQAYRAYLLSHKVEVPRRLFLYGPPASGKSTWARRIAQATGWRRIDLDEEVVKFAGKTIPEIFAAEGEKGFRAIEKSCLEEVCKGEAAGEVIALGGGALLDPESRKQAERTGRVVVLNCPLEILKSRLTGGSRPLSTDPKKLEALVSERSRHYNSFHPV